MIKTDSVKAVLFFGNPARKYSRELLEKSYASVSKRFSQSVFYSNINYPGCSPVEGDFFPVLRNISENCCKDDRDTIAVFQGISPLFDSVLADEALFEHSRYLSHFTYSEDIPPGFIPDFVSKEFIDELQKKDNSALISLEAFRKYAFKNIDEFDINIFYRTPDLRQYRLDFTCETDRSEALVHKIIQGGENTSFASLQNRIKENPEFMHLALSCLEISLTERSDLQPVFYPHKKNNHISELSSIHLESILTSVERHPFAEDLTVCLGGFGESLFYPGITDLLSRLLESSRVKTIYLETYGVNISEEVKKDLFSLINQSKLNIIFKITTLNEKIYADLYGKNRLKEALAFLSECRQSGLSVYSEMIKMKEVESGISDYFTYFEGKNIPVILAKYNSYIGSLEERRVSDLTPLERDFCWHLARDIYITADGRIPICRQDPFAESEKSFSLDDISFSEAYRKHTVFHNHSVLHMHEKIPMDCLKCDEWYTFIG